MSTACAGSVFLSCFDINSLLVVYCESVNLIDYITVFYLLIENTCTCVFIIIVPEKPHWGGSIKYVCKYVIFILHASVHIQSHSD